MVLVRFDDTFLANTTRILSGPTRIYGAHVSQRLASTIGSHRNVGHVFSGDGADKTYGGSATRVTDASIAREPSGSFPK